MTAVTTHLTPRQRAILDQLTLDGATNRTIAERLGISENAVRGGVEALMGAFGTRNRTAVAVAALKRRGPAEPITHLGPAPGARLRATGCCHHLLDDLPGTDGVTRAPDRVTCGKVEA